jgi:hypothetical protein
MGPRVVSSGTKQQEREADHSSPPRPEMKNCGVTRLFTNISLLHGV